MARNVSGRTTVGTAVRGLPNYQAWRPQGNNWSTPAVRWSAVTSSGGGPRRTYAVICQKAHLDTGAHGPFHLVGRRPGYSRCVSPHGGPGPGSVCVLLFRATGTDKYGPGCPATVSANGGLLPDMGDESESDHSISPAREQGHGKKQPDVR